MDMAHRSARHRRGRRRYRTGPDMIRAGTREDTEAPSA